MSIADLLQVLRKRLLTFLITAIVVFAGVAAVTFLSPSKYTSTAELFATYNGQSGSENNPNPSDVNSGTSYLSTQIKTYPQLVKTEAVLKPVIDELGLDLTVDELSDAVTATNPANTFMLDISVEVGDAQQSATIANSVAANLSEQITSAKSALYSDSSSKSLVQLSVVQKASVPTSPSSPRVSLYLAVGFVLAIIIGIVAALLKDVLNTKIDSSHEVRDLTESSPLGVVPNSELLDDTKPVVVSQPSAPVTEEFRRIRTNISFLNTDLKTKGHLLVISSTDPSEGKTTTSVNIAAAIAEEGKTVLLIDADLRHPSVAAKVGLEGHVGLSHILSGQAKPADIVQAYWKPNLQILPAGKRPGNASILLNSPVMKDLIEAARNQYDYVILDTTPLSVANDATIFGKLAHGIIMVVGKGVADKRELQETVQSLKSASVPILGFVLNFANPKKLRANSYYYYYADGVRQNGKGRKH